MNNETTEARLIAETNKCALVSLDKKCQALATHFGVLPEWCAHLVRENGWKVFKPAIELTEDDCIGLVDKHILDGTAYGYLDYEGNGGCYTTAKDSLYSMFCKEGFENLLISDIIILTKK